MKTLLDPTLKSLIKGIIEHLDDCADGVIVTDIDDLAHAMPDILLLVHEYFPNGFSQPQVKQLRINLGIPTEFD